MVHSGSLIFTDAHEFNDKPKNRSFCYSFRLYGGRETILAIAVVRRYLNYTSRRESEDLTPTKTMLLPVRCREQL